MTETKSQVWSTVWLQYIIGLKLNF